MGTRFNLFPVVLDSSGVPWAEATVYILSKLEGSIRPSMGTYSGIANDLAAFRRFIDETGIDWTKFAKDKLRRPTYRYNGHLWLMVTAREIAATTARRRMGAVIAFYRWLRDEGVLVPDHAPWNESDRYIEFSDARGFKLFKQVKTTDLSIGVPKANDPYSTEINDGGKLRPLPQEEQQWVLEALLATGNTELTLIHLLAMLTGARIQTVLTFRVGHVLREWDSSVQGEVRIPVGHGTGIDSKDNKQMVLHVPIMLYEALSRYAKSERAVKRRDRAMGGNTLDQYLFLSVRGAPLYESKATASDYDDKNELRHAKAGQGVRQLITDYVIPYVRVNHIPDFKYRFHDMRATYGMNLTDEQLRRVAADEITLHEAREFVKSRMGHESAAVTDRYLQYRGKLKFIRSVNDGYGIHLQALVARACEDAI
jgi:integrase